MKSIVLAVGMVMCLPSLAGSINSDGVAITTQVNTGGALYSIRWGGMEFLDHYDLGRLGNSAVSCNGLGERYNPTKGGSRADGPMSATSHSSSYVFNEYAAGNTLSNMTLMAYWDAFNGYVMSNHVHAMTVTTGFAGIKGAIKYDSVFYLPSNESFSICTFETFTAYLPATFNKFYTVKYDVTTNQTVVNTLSVCVDSEVAGNCPNYSPEQGLPIVFSNFGGTYALGIYSPRTPQPQYPAAGYGRSKYSVENVVKMNNVYRINNPSGAIPLVTYICIGSLNDVLSCQTALQKMTL